MKYRATLKFVIVFAILVCSPFARAADTGSVWPQFRGPAGSGVADDQQPPTEIGPEKNVKWKVAVPSGSSSPIVVGDKLVLTAFDDGKLFTIAYARADGKELWRKEAPAKQIEAYHKTEGSPAASTPATDGHHIVSYFGSCGLFCYNPAGNELWRYEMPPAQTLADFGTGVSPIIVGDEVVLLRDEKVAPEILAVDLNSGKRKWETKRQSTSSFGTPVIWQTSEAKQVVAGGYGRMIAYDASTGEEIWSVAGMPSACCTTPVIGESSLLFAGWSPGDAEDKDFKMPTFDELLKQGDTNGDGILSKAESDKTFLKGFFDNNDADKDGQITREEWDKSLKFISASKNAAFAVKPGGKGDITATHVLWKKAKGLPYVPSAIAYKGQYVMIKDGGLVTAYDVDTGKEIYVQQRVAAEGRYYSSPVAAAGNIYFTSLDDGIVTVMKAGSTTPEVVVKNPPLEERVAATPAIAENTLYLRTAGHLYAFAQQ